MNKTDDEIDAILKQENKLLLASDLSNNQLIINNECCQENKTDIKFVDQALAVFGLKNVYIIYIWFSMGTLWAIAAMPIMVNAFFQLEICSTNDYNCNNENGTIIKEFNLKKNQYYLINYISSIFLLGVTIGSVLIPHFSDKKGRKFTLIFSIFLLSIFGIFAAIAPNIYIFILCRFMQGIFYISCVITNWVLAYESIPLKLRSYTALLFGLFWVFGYCIVSPLAYIFQNVRFLMLAISAPTAILAFIYYLTIPESFYYLLVNNKINSLNKWIEKANYFADWNNSPKLNLNAKELYAIIYFNKVIKKKYSFCQFFKVLFNNKTLLIHTLVMICLWFCNSFIYYGLSLYSTQFAGNKYINFILIGLIEVPSYIISPFFLDKLGRRYFISFCHFLASFSFITIFFLHDSKINLIMWLIGKFAIANSYTSIFVYASELFPTNIRNSCIGLCSFISQIGTLFAPTIKLMAIFSIKMPTIFFASCAAISGAATLILPETLNKELPD